MSEHTPLTEAERAALVADARSHRRSGTGCSSCVDGIERLDAALADALAARTSTATADTGLRERVEAAREQIRQQMLKAEFTDDRNTYGDGYGNGLAHALDFLRPALATPASTEDRADNEGTPPRPEPGEDDDGYPALPDGWASVVMGTNADTGAVEVLAGRTDDGTFHQYADTEHIVTVCTEALKEAHRG